jgi:predicted membrane metal-binding protein
MFLRLASIYAAALLLPWRWALPVAVACFAARRLRRGAAGARSPVRGPRAQALGELPACVAALVLGLAQARPVDVPFTACLVEASGWIVTPPEGDGHRWRATLQVDDPAMLPPHVVPCVQLVSRTPLPAYGSRLRVRGRLRPPRPPRHFVPGSEAAWLAPSGIGAVLDVEAVVPLAGSGGPAWRRTLVEPLRTRLAASLSAALAPREAALLQALVVGQRSGLDAATRDAWAALGVNHILSISGMHVALVAGAALALGGDPRRGRGLMLLLAAVWGYAALGGAGPTVPARHGHEHLGGARGLLGSRPPSVARSSGSPGSGSFCSCRRGVTTWVCSCRARRRRGCSPRHRQPRGSPRGSRRGGRGGRLAAWVAASAMLGLAAQAATLPLQLWSFGALSWIAPLANCLMVPLTDAALVVALVGMPLSLIGTLLGRPLLVCAGGLVWLACEIAAWGQRAREPAMVPARRCHEPDVGDARGGRAARRGLGNGCESPAVQHRERRLGMRLDRACSRCSPDAPRRRPGSSKRSTSGKEIALLLDVGGAAWLIDCGDAQPVDSGAPRHPAALASQRHPALARPGADPSASRSLRRAASVLAAIRPDTLYVAAASLGDTLYARLRAAHPEIPWRGLATGDRLGIAPDYQATVVLAGKHRCPACGPQRLLARSVAAGRRSSRSRALRRSRGGRRSACPAALGRADRGREPGICRAQGGTPRQQHELDARSSSRRSIPRSRSSASARSIVTGIPASARSQRSQRPARASSVPIPVARCVSCSAAPVSGSNGRRPLQPSAPRLIAADGAPVDAGRPPP